MNDSFAVFIWTLGGLLAFALLGALFGGLAGWFHSRSGHAGGTVLARKVASALARLASEEMNGCQRGALIGAVDGGMFLGMAGLLVGLGAGWRGVPPGDWLLPVFQITLLLAGLAFAFGLLALGIIRLQMRAILPLFLGGIAGAVLTARLAGAAHVVPGAVGGLAAGTLIAFLLPRF